MSLSFFIYLVHPSIPPKSSLLHRGLQGNRTILGEPFHPNYNILSDPDEHLLHVPVLLSYTFDPDPTHQTKGMVAPDIHRVRDT